MIIFLKKEKKLFGRFKYFTYLCITIKEINNNN